MSLERWITSALVPFLVLAGQGHEDAAIGGESFATADLREIVSSVEERLARTVPERALLFEPAVLAAGEPIATWIGDLPTVSIDDERLWIAEGDLLLDTAGLSDYAFRREVEETARRMRELAVRIEGPEARAGLAGDRQEIESAGLLAETFRDTNRLVRWRPGLVLTYRVVRATFPTEEAYDRVVADIRVATEAWEGVCGVAFQHRADLDARDGIGQEGAVFAVRYVASAGTSGQLIAAAFFPQDPPSRRRVVITPRFFDTDFDTVGVLRHELGHVLGFRHEHIRSGAPPDCPNESTAHTVDLTKYDPRSVMHYFCGGVGDKALAFTELDRTGARSLYGLPLDQLEFFE